jgi:hypothetical protein
LEKGGNITMQTFEKIVAQLPNLKELIIGGVRVTISGADVEDVRAAVAEADRASRRLLSLLDTVRAHAPGLELRLAELERKVQAIQGEAEEG